MRVVRAHRCGQGLGETHEGHPWQLEDCGARTAPRAASTHEGRSLPQKVVTAAGRSAGMAQRSGCPSRSLTPVPVETVTVPTEEEAESLGDCILLEHRAWWRVGPRGTEEGDGSHGGDSSDGVGTYHSDTVFNWAFMCQSTETFPVSLV